MRWRDRRGQVVGGALVALYVVTKLVLAKQSGPESFADSASYTTNGWAHTVRPFGISFLFDRLGSPSAIVSAQTIISALCWSWLFAELWTTLRPGHPRRAGAIVGVLAVASLTGPVVMWDRTVLSESLAIGVLAATAAAAVRIRRTRASRGAVVAGFAVLVVSGFIRETVFFAFAAPIALVLAALIPARRIGRVPVRLLSVTATLITVVALGLVVSHPGSVVYGPHGESLDNFRTMNVIGVRVLPDPWVRNRLAGVPSTTPELRTRRQAFDDDWLLYKHPELLRFANDFPWARYLVVQMSRPRTFVRLSLPALDRAVPDNLGGYRVRGDELVPHVVASALWGWTGGLHVAFTAAAVVLVIALRRRLSIAERHSALGALGISVLSAVGAIAAQFFDSMEIHRHAFPFLLASRFSLLVAVLITVTALAPGLGTGLIDRSSTAQ